MRAAVAMVAMLLAGAPAAAQNEPVRIFNRTSQPATAVHVVRSGQAGWSANLLRSGTLAPGQFLSVRLGEGAGCRFDLRLVLQDGTEVLRDDADVCATRSVDVAPPSGPPATPAPTAPLPQVGGADGLLPSIGGTPRR